MDVTIIVKVYS